MQASFHINVCSIFNTAKYMHVGRMQFVFQTALMPQKTPNVGARTWKWLLEQVLHILNIIYVWRRYVTSDRLPVLSELQFFHLLKGTNLQPRGWWENLMGDCMWATWWGGSGVRRGSVSFFKAWVLQADKTCLNPSSIYHQLPPSLLPNSSLRKRGVFKL